MYNFNTKETFAENETIIHQTKMNFFFFNQTISENKLRLLNTMLVANSTVCEMSLLCVTDRTAAPRFSHSHQTVIDNQKVRKN